MPGGNILNCYNGNPPPQVFCPAGTDLAGLPMPQGNPALCDDDVLGDLINRGDIDGNAQQRPAVRGGRILPFTGSSILGFVLLGVQLLLAGGLFMRGRKRSAR
jgi:LPXTG-motif cell wall-anchored protein